MHVQQIIPRIKIANQSPILEMMENDQVFPAGMWRWRIQGDIAILERATAADWTTDEDWVAYDKGNEVSRFIKAIATQDGGELTIAVGVITVTVTKHTVDTEADAATDLLDTINGAGFIGQLLILGSENDARDIILRDYNDSGGNIACGGAGATVVLQNVVDRVMLQWDGTYWCVIADSISNQASGSATFSVAAVDSLNPGRADYQCDGVADEVEINAALAAVNAAGVGGKVVLMEGNFAIATNIVVPVDLTLEGQGLGTVLLADGAVVTNVILVNGARVTIRNMWVQLAAGAGAALTRPNIISCTNFDHLLVENVWAIGDLTVGDDGSDVRQVGILLNTSEESKVINCRAENNQRYGIRIAPCNDCLVSGCNSIGNASFGIYVRGNDNTIDANNCYNNTSHGIQLYEDSFNTQVTGNICEGNGGDGIYVWHDSYWNSITGNVCKENTNYGIRLNDNCRHNTISGNVCEGNGAHGILLIGSSVWNTISGNTCEDNVGGGVYIQDSGSNTIVGNNCYGNTNYGIMLRSVVRCVVTGNFCSNTTVAGVGIMVYRSSYCVVTGNASCNNTTDGISVTGDATENADYNTVTGNVCTANTDDGIAIEGGLDANHNIVTSNQCTGNTGTSLVNNGTNTDLGHNKT